MHRLKNILLIGKFCFATFLYLIEALRLFMGGKNKKLSPRFYDTQRVGQAICVITPKSNGIGYRICMMTHINQFVLVK